MDAQRSSGRRALWLLATGGVVAAMLAADGPATAAAWPGGRPPAVRVVSLTAPERSALLALYASYLGIPRGDIAGVRPGTLHAAHQAPGGTEWATASFLPALTAPLPVQVRFQDGASTVVFTRPDGRPWQIVRAGGEPLSCAGVLPPGVARVWRLAGPAGCPVTGRAAPAARLGNRLVPETASLAAIVQVAIQNVGVGDNPASTRFSFNCDPYTTLVGVRARARRCRTDKHFAVRDENELWCADFAKWVWAQGGVTADLATLTPAASSFYAWGKQQGERMPAHSLSPVPGDAVVFYPAGERPGASYADHVGLVTAVNADGTVNLVNGDFAGSSNITVQASTGVSLATWAAAMWGPGEKWIFVSPVGQLPPVPRRERHPHEPHHDQGKRASR